MGMLLQQAAQQNQALQTPSAPAAQQNQALQTPSAPAAQAQPARMLQPQAQPDQGERASVDKFVNNALRIIHTPQVTDGILNTISKSQDKVDGVGEAAVEVADRISDSAGKESIKIDINTISHGINAIVGEVVNLAETAGIASLVDEQKYQAYSWALSNFLDRSVKKGNITKDDLISLGQQAVKTPEGEQVAKQFGGV